MNNIEKFKQLISEFETPKKRFPLSVKYPFFKTIIVGIRIILTKLKNRFLYKIARKKGTFLKCVLARHQSILRRQLGSSDPELQERKIINLKKACESLNGLIIYPDEIFSLWEVIGKPEKKKGYVNGMLLSNGKIIEGIGGGLCQLSNFLCWILLHTETEIVERYHHSMDVFPDSGRALPFGSGATCLYNFVDLKVKNISSHPIQIKIWLTEKHLKGQILSTDKNKFKFSIQEKNHCFIKRNNHFFRYNEIYRIRKKEGKKVDEEFLFMNFAPVLYKIPKDYFKRHGFKLFDLSDKQ